MNWNQRLMRALRAGFERHARVRTLGVLRGMNERQLRDLGFSPDLIREGVSAWPWRIEQVEVLHDGQSNRQVWAAEAELNAYSDAEPADFGLSRDDIPDAVRNGRSSTDRVAA